MELKYDAQVSLELLTEIEEIIMADKKPGVSICSVGECELHRDLGHLFNGLVLSYIPTNTETFVKVIKKLEEWSKGTSTT